MSPHDGYLKHPRGLTAAEVRRVKRAFAPRPLRAGVDAVRRPAALSPEEWSTLHHRITDLIVQMPRPRNAA